MIDAYYIVQIGKEQFKFDSKLANTAIGFAEMARNYNTTNAEIKIELIDKKNKDNNK